MRMRREAQSATRDRCEVNWIGSDSGADAVKGKVRWDPAHSLWNGGMLVVALAFGAQTFTWDAFAVFILLSGAFILLGHSLGFHRLLIHQSFRTLKLLRYFLIWCGVMAGMSGPHWIIKAHDLRDWAQRQAKCHPYLSHRSAIWRDAWWQLHCRLQLERPPQFDLGEVGKDRFLRFLEASWMLHQLPLALILLALGGWGWVVWGICARVAVTVHGHWFVGYFAHRRGPQSNLVRDAGVQAHDVPWAATLTMGEAWHNNHHAYPGSAKIGIYPGQSDWGYALIAIMQKCGLVWDVCLPSDMPDRKRSLESVL